MKSSYILNQPLIVFGVSFGTSRFAYAGIECEVLCGKIPNHQMILQILPFAHEQSLWDSGKKQSCNHQVSFHASSHCPCKLMVCHFSFTQGYQRSNHFIATQGESSLPQLWFSDMLYLQPSWVCKDVELWVWEHQGVGGGFSCFTPIWISPNLFACDCDKHSQNSLL